MSNSDDLSSLMRAARAGDDEAYRRLLMQVATWLRGITRRSLAAAGRRVDDSEDIVQEALLAMHLKRDTWDEMQPLEPWLRAIARHKLVDHLRRGGVADHVDIEDLIDSLAAPANDPAGSAAAARHLLAGLPERQRHIVEGISLEGQSAREVGARLGMSEGAVRVTLHRALKALADAYRRDRS